MTLVIALACWQLCGLTFLFYCTPFDSSKNMMESFVTVVLINLLAALWPLAFVLRLCNQQRAERKRRLKAVLGKLRA